MSEKPKKKRRGSGKPFVAGDPLTHERAKQAAAARWAKKKSEERAIEHAFEVRRELGFVEPIARPEYEPHEVRTEIPEIPDIPIAVVAKAIKIVTAEYDSAKYSRLCPAGCGLPVVTDRIESLAHVVREHLGEIEGTAPRCKVIRAQRGWL